jgi:hypothetical protein
MQRQVSVSTGHAKVHSQRPVLWPHERLVSRATSIIAPLALRHIEMATNPEILSHFVEAQLIHATLMPSFVERIEDESQ